MSLSIFLPAMPPLSIPHSPDHIHPILVNFTAALVPVSFFCDVVGRARRKQSLTDAAWWTLLIAACVTPFTGLAGLMWKKSVADMVPAEVLRTHEWLGITMAVALILLAIWRGRIHARSSAPSAGYLVITLIVVAALAYQGSLGGAMVFGP
jgi:uncharacterized membrane protein